MKTSGKPRRDLLASLCPRHLSPIVDVGADHGHVAKAVGGIATERMPGRMGRGDVPWIICDGLTAFRSVGVAIIAGMGARTIAGILDAAPRPRQIIVHAQDDPPLLRSYLANNGWQILREALAPEAGRYSEVIVAHPGQETSSGLSLHYGPRLLKDGDPHLIDHLEQLCSHSADIARATKTNARAIYEREQQRLDFLKNQLKYWTTDTMIEP